MFTYNIPNCKFKIIFSSSNEEGTTGEGINGEIGREFNVKKM